MTQQIGREAFLQALNKLEDDTFWLTGVEIELPGNQPAKTDEATHTMLHWLENCFNRGMAISGETVQKADNGLMIEASFAGFESGINVGFTAYQPGKRITIFQVYETDLTWEEILATFPGAFRPEPVEHANLVEIQVEQSFGVDWGALFWCAIE